MADINSEQVAGLLRNPQITAIAATVIDLNLWTRLKLSQSALPVAE